MEAGRRVYHRHLEDMASIANEALEYFRGATVGQHRVVEVQAPPDLPLVLVDREAWVDAIVNLLTNAHKYSAQSEPVWVRVWAERGAVHVAVRDRGIGIALREHRRVFEKFYRVDDRLSRDIEGSGLGLSIVKHVVQAHGGKVALKSALGQGSVFTLSVPVAEPAKALAAVAMASSTPPPPSAGEEA